MFFLRFLVFICIFCAITSKKEFSCPKGEMVYVEKKVPKCKPCPSEYFQPENNTSKFCKSCGKCDEYRGSKVVVKCTSITNTKCQCRENFVPLEEDSSTCKCAEGFSKHSKECVKQEANTSNKIPHLITSLTSPRPHEGARTQVPPQKVTTATGQKVLTTTPKEKAQDSHTLPIVVGLILVMLVLLVLTVLTFKKNILSRMQRKPERTRDFSYRTPVEESGHGSQDSLKQNPEEP